MGSTVEVKFSAKNVMEAAKMRQKFINLFDVAGYRSSDIQFHVKPNGAVQATLILVRKSR